MSDKPRSENPLDDLLGSQLSSVEFVQDYIQFHFDGPTLSAVADPEVYVDGQCYRKGASGFCEALLARIAKRVRRTTLVPDEKLELEFSDGAVIRVPLGRPPIEGSSAESASYRGTAPGDWSWWE